MPVVVVVSETAQELHICQMCTAGREALLMPAQSVHTHMLHNRWLAVGWDACITEVVVVVPFGVGRE